jgi:hypothetical protein
LRRDRGGNLPGDLSLTLEIKTRCHPGLDRLLLQDEGFVLIVRFDELHGDQHHAGKEEADAYPDIVRLVVSVHEEFLSPTELLTQGIENSVTGGPLG